MVLIISHKKPSQGFPYTILATLPLAVFSTSILTGKASLSSSMWVITKILAKSSRTRLMTVPASFSP